MVLLRKIFFDPSTEAPMLDDRNQGLQIPEAYIPGYVQNPLPRPKAVFTRILLSVMGAIIRGFIWVFLRPRRGNVGNLDIEEVMRVYEREAHGYDRKHHFTTRGQDLTWRREAGWCALTYRGDDHQSPPMRILDICTGTGLTSFEVAHMLRMHDLPYSIIGIDMSVPMLRVAQARFHGQDDPLRFRKFTFAQDDAKTLSLVASGSIDFAMQMFGIGGIDDPVPVFGSVLRSLKEGGRFYLVDMHRPIPELPGEWPLMGKWWRMPLFEATTYLETTMPLALARLWGWRDPTVDFYLLPYITYRDANGSNWGFRLLWRKQETERWWLGAPVMPTARVLAEKVLLSEKEASRRESIVSVILQKFPYTQTPRS